MAWTWFPYIYSSGTLVAAEYGAYSIAHVLHVKNIKLAGMYLELYAR